MISLCVVNIVLLWLKPGAMSTAVLATVANPVFFCVVESRLLFKFKEDTSMKSGLGVESISTVSEIEFSHV